MRRFLQLVLFLSLLATRAFAASPIEDVSFADAEQEARYKELITILRCPKCLNANLAGSDAQIAADMRAKIREQLAEGLSDDEIKDFWVARYGEFVLYRPRLSTATAALWFGPFVLLIAGFLILRRMLATSRNTAVEASLSAEEALKLQTLLNGNKDAR
jgi:cytochrome c-type biogenesis protein CcmH